jgi:hypothetical protein
MRILHLLSLATAGICLSAPLYAETNVARNDGLATTDAASFEISVDGDSVIASCFDTNALPFPRSVTEVRVLFGAALETTRELDVLVYTRDRLAGPPETFVERQTVTVTHQPGLLTNVVLTTPVQVSSSFCIGLSSDDRISIGSSGSSGANGANWVDSGTGTFATAADTGVDGDFVIRVVTQDGGGNADADVGVDADTGIAADAGADAGGVDASSGGAVRLLSVSPTRGSLSEFVELDLVGEGFSEDLVYRVGPQPLDEVVVRSPRLVVATLPPGTLDPGTYDVIVSDNGEIVGRLEQGYQAVTALTDNPPVILSVSPDRYAFRRTVELFITGQNFEENAQLFVGGAVVGTRTVISESTMQAILIGNTLPSPGSYDVTITNPDGLSATATGAFTVIEATDEEGGCSTHTSNRGSLPTLLFVAAMTMLAGRRRRV